jgi:hypothetical protein
MRFTSLAANIGGIGFIESHKAEIMRDSALINLHMIEAAHQNRVERFLFSSSACLYPGCLQQTSRGGPAQGGGCLPGRWGRWLRLGKLFMERATTHSNRSCSASSTTVASTGTRGTYCGQAAVPQSVSSAPGSRLVLLMQLAECTLIGPRRPSGMRQASGQYVLTGLLHCKSCGERMRGEHLKAARYRCGGEARACAVHKPSLLSTSRAPCSQP